MASTIVLAILFHMHRNYPRKITTPKPDRQFQKWNRVSGSRVTGSAILAGSGSRVSVSDPVFDPVLSFNMHIYRGVVSAE